MEKKWHEKKEIEMKKQLSLPISWGFASKRRVNSRYSIYHISYFLRCLSLSRSIVRVPLYLSGASVDFVSSPARRRMATLWSICSVDHILYIFHHNITIWLYDYMTIWLYDYMTIWLYDYMTIWLYDYMTIWLYDYMMMIYMMTIWLMDVYGCIWMYMAGCQTVVSRTRPYYRNSNGACFKIFMCLSYL